MKRLIVVFRSKTDVFGYMEELADRGIPSGTTGTPKEARIGCGIAVDLDHRYLADPRVISLARRFGGFYGVFVVERIADRVSTSRLT